MRKETNPEKPFFFGGGGGYEFSLAQFLGVLNLE